MSVLRSSEMPPLFAAGERSLPAMLRRQAEKFGAKILVQAGDRRWSFAEAPELAARAAGRLAEAGVVAGDRVALICSNRAEFIDEAIVLAHSGAISLLIT